MTKKNRLPKIAIPNRYEINLDVDIDNFKYKGDEVVYLEIVEDTVEFELNSVGIDIHNAFVENDNNMHHEASVNYVKEDEKIILTFEETVKAGDWKLYISFDAEIVDDLRGFYRSSFKDSNGIQKWIATTQFEPTAARMAFPCWDEPEYKSVFSVSLTSNSNLVRISNEKVLSENTENGKTTTKFVDSMRMSTYLVAFVVGDLEITDIGEVNGTFVRVVHRPGFSNQTAFAGQAAIKILEFFENYYEIDYPGSKLDLISIPDFAMGAMENIGAITFRETLLLIDVKKATRAELSRSVEVIAHELAHMWFGDLVTMKWWDGIWLNEAFASLMEVIASEGTYPEFKLWNELNLARTQGFNVDSLKTSRPIEFEVETPEQAEEMFDVLTYQKGSTVLRMFETFVGEENFRLGVVNYLNKFKYKNTHSTDLWNELSKTSDYRLEEILPTWIHQEGYPIISVHLEDNKIFVSQERFLISGDSDETIWKVPLNIRYLDSDSIDKILFSEKQSSFQQNGSVPFVNNGGWSFFHTSYSEDLLKEIIKNFNQLDTNEKYRFLEDAWMSLRVGKLSYENFLEILKLYSKFEEVNTWSLISGIISTLNKIMQNNSIKEFTKEFCTPLLNKLGKEYVENIEKELAQLKSQVCNLYANVCRDEEFISYFSDQFKSGKYEEYAEGSYYNLVLSISSLDKSISSKIYIEKFNNSESPQLQARYRNVLGLVENEDSPANIIDSILSEAIRGADAPYVLSSLIANSNNGHAAWKMITKHWSELLNMMPEWTSSRILDYLPSIYDKELGTEIEKFLLANPLPAAEKITKQKLERLRANINFANIIKAI